MLSRTEVKLLGSRPSYNCKTCPAHIWLFTCEVHFLLVGNYSKPSNWMGFLGLERSKTTQIFLHMFVTCSCNAPRNLKVQIVQDISSLLSLNHCNFKQNSLNYIHELPYLDLPQAWPLEYLGCWGWISHSLIIIREVVIFTLAILLALLGYVY